MFAGGGAVVQLAALGKAPGTGAQAAQVPRLAAAWDKGNRNRDCPTACPTASRRAQNALSRSRTHASSQSIPGVLAAVAMARAQRLLLLVLLCGAACALAARRLQFAFETRARGFVLTGQVITYNDYKMMIR